MISRTDPGAAQHRGGAVGVGGGHEHAALAQQPPARGVGQRDAAEALAAHAGETVVQGETLVDVGEIGAEQIEHTPVLAEDRADEQLDLALERFTQRRVEIREDVGVRIDALERAQLQPLHRELRHERFRTRVGEQAPDLRFDDRRLGQAAVLGQLQQLVVRRPGGEEEREP
jgi:hypothetical protein